MAKTYATASNARRAARAAIKNPTDGKTAEEKVDFTIEGNKADGFYWRRVQVETKAPTAPAAKKEAPVAPPKADEYAEPPEDASQPEEGLSDINFEKTRRKGAVREVWDICEENKDLRRKDVIAICVAKGINYYTARTQYQAWRTAHKNSQ